MIKHNQFTDMQTIEFGDDQQNLLCKKCGWDFIHHKDMEIFEQKEDEKLCLYTGIRIKFECARCTKVSYFLIKQHKGMTLVDWEMDCDG